jgi:restriction endonuclease S subunit
MSLLLRQEGIGLARLSIFIKFSFFPTFKALLFKDYPNLLLPDTIFKIEYKPERINGIFLWRLLSNNHIRAQLTKLATGSAGSMPNISKKKLMALQIIVPPLKLQNHFARIVEQSQEVKEHYRASQQSLENLYQSLSQRVFSDPSILGKRTQHDQNVLRDEKTVV